jgi:putative CocE/NonD family hydrolase
MGKWHRPQAWMRAIAMLALLTSAGLHAAPVAERVSSPGIYRGYSEQRYSEWLLKSEYVAVRDGTRLAVDIYRPAAGGRAVEEKLPVIWVHTPYRRAYINDQGKRVSAAEQLGLLQILRYGYVIAIVDTRGRGASMGIRRGFQDRTEALDAYDMTEWLAVQPWSDGNVGITGCSYLGGSALQATTVGAPHLRAAAPGCTDFDKYSFVSRGGITAQFNTRPENPEQDFGQGVAPVDVDLDGRMAAQAIETHRAGTPMAELWRGMPFRDDVSPLVGTRFWDEVNVGTYTKVVERSKVGLFIWGNWKDEGSFEATLAFNNLDNPRKLWMGGWGHCQVADFPMATELLRFFDYFLKRIDNGWLREPPIYYYTINAPKGLEWQSATRWPLSAAHTQQLLLGGVATPGNPGLLGQRVQAIGADHFTVDYAPVCKQAVDLYFIFWPCVIDQHGLGFQTEPMTADTQVVGNPLADLWISASTTDADLFVYLEDIAPDGKVDIVTHGRLRASHRGEQRPPFRNFMGLPYHRGNRADSLALVADRPTRMRVALLPTSMIIRAGHRLRLSIAGADPRQRSRTLSFDPPPTIRIYHDALHRSALNLPVL